jgi:hypothetical protein
VLQIVTAFLIVKGIPRTDEAAASLQNGQAKSFVEGHVRFYKCEEDSIGVSTTPYTL